MLLTITAPDGTTYSREDEGEARILADSLDLGSTIVDEHGICIYITTPAMLAGDDSFSE